MPAYASITQIQQEIEQGRLTCTELVGHYLRRIESTRELNIYLEIYAEEALDRAREIDQLPADQKPPLHGLVVSHKDVICYAGHGVQAASQILDGFTSTFTATALDRLIQAGAIVIGRTNCDEFAMGSDNTRSAFGPTRNAQDPEYVPGGSSGASAVAVQADTCLIALGSDTGGSVRQPAAFCGVVGFKPTYGRLSRHGLLAYGSSFDQIGLLAHNVQDIARVLSVMAGPDEYDATAISQPMVPIALGPSEASRRIAYFPEAFHHPDLDPEIRDINAAFVTQLQDAGHTVEPVSFAYLDYMIPAYYVLTTAEASSNLSRYDGVRYGYRSPSADNLLDTYRKTRTEGFGPEVKRRVMLGTFVLSAGYYDAYYAKAQKVRRLIYERTREILAAYDFILMPAAPGTPWKIGEKQDSPTAMYLADIFTVQANLVGIPAISWPLGTHSNGWPVGIQLMADRLQEHTLLAFADQWLPKE